MADTPTDFTAERLARRLHDLAREAFAWHPAPEEVAYPPWDELTPVGRDRYRYIARGLLGRGPDAPQSPQDAPGSTISPPGEPPPRPPYHGERPLGAGFEDDRGGYDDLDPADRPRF